MPDLNILANILAAIGIILEVAATFCKSKFKVLIWQSIGYIFMVAANFTVGAVVAAIIMFVNIFKNFLGAKDKLSWPVIAIFSGIYIVACIFTYKQPVDLISVVASIQYLLFIKFSKTEKGVKAGIAVNSVFWAISDGYFKLLFMFVGDIVLICTSVYNICKKKSPTI